VPSAESVYNSDNVLSDSERDGWSLGLIGIPWPGPWPKLNGDLFVVAPGGGQAGLAWESTGPDILRISGPSEGRWGVYQVRFPLPVLCHADLVRNFYEVLPLLKAEYENTQRSWGGQDART